MAFTSDRAGSQPINVTSTVQNIALGTIVKGVDPTLGEGEFIYLLGATSTVVGLAYQWNATTFQTVVLPVTANLSAPVGWAMSANVAAQYGWYQIGGLAKALKSAVKSDPAVNANRVYISGTAGRVMQTSAAGRCIMGALRANLTTVTSTTSLTTLSINRPHCQGPIT
jgi:hypothetical protein